MYRHIDQHIEALLDLLRKNKHVQDYDNLMRAFTQADTAVDMEFQRHYAHFWALGPGVDKPWRRNYFLVLQEVRTQRELDPQQRRQLLERVCHETLGERKGGRSLQFSFTTKLVHTAAPTSPIYDDKVRAFFLLPYANHGGDIARRIGPCLDVYDAVVKEYDRILDKHLLDRSIALFRKELHPETFTDIKVIDSLIWAFMSWAMQGRAFGGGELRYE
jgi:hypothetical protein